MTNSPRIYLRPAKASDRDAVLKFTEHTYEWGDYISMAWDRWFNEPATQWLVATIHRQPVGIIHLAMLNATEAWLEGLRADPAHHRHGIATNLFRYSINEATKRGARVIRFATASDNTPVHHLAAAFGFKKVTVILPGEAKAKKSKIVLARPDPAELPKLIAFVKTSRVLKSEAGLTCTGWRFHRLTPAFLETKLKEDMLRKMSADGKLKALAVVAPGFREEGLVITYIDGDPDAVKTLALGLRNEAATFESRRIASRLPESSPVNGDIAAAGFKPRDDNPFWIYELKLPAV